MGTDLASLVQRHRGAYILGHKENASLRVQEQSTWDQRPEHGT